MEVRIDRYCSIDHSALISRFHHRELATAVTTIAAVPYMMMICCSLLALQLRKHHPTTMQQQQHYPQQSRLSTVRRIIQSPPFLRGATVLAIVAYVLAFLLLPSFQRQRVIVDHIRFDRRTQHCPAQ